VARNWDGINHAITKIHTPDFVGPVVDSIEALGGFQFRRDEGHGHRGVVHRLNFRVSSDVIRVGMGVDSH
jgi:hypothetical protein